MLRRLAAEPVPIAATPTALSSTASSGGTTFGTGNLFAGVNNGTVHEYMPSGSLAQTLSIGAPGQTTGMAFDALGNFYVTGFDDNLVAKFSPSGQFLGYFGDGYRTPESIAIDANGTIHVGNTGKAFGGNGGIRAFDSQGTFIAEFASGQQVDWIAFVPGSTTLLYTQEGHDIKAIDVSTGEQLPDFTTGTLDEAYSLRVLPDGSVLVAETIDVALLDPWGNIVQRYDAPGQTLWFALALDPDGTSFWAGDHNSGDVFRFDIASAEVLQSFTTVLGLNGLEVYPGVANQPPVNTVPGSQSTDEDTPLSFSNREGNAIAVFDPDANANPIQVTLEVSRGTLTVADTTGLTFVFGSNGGATMTFQGLQSAINTALDGLSYNPAADYNGPDTLTITTADLGNAGTGGSLTDTDSVSITVERINDAPSFMVGPDQTIGPDAGPQTVTGWATDISAGPADESGQTLTFIVTGNTNPSLFAEAPAVDAAGTLTYTPAGGATGSATISLVLRDDGGTEREGEDRSEEQSFVVTIQDSAPIVGISDVMRAEGNAGITQFLFNVTLSKPTAQTVAVDFETRDGTATAGIALLGDDYRAKRGTVTFAPGTTQTIVVDVFGDREKEFDEFFFVELTAARFAEIGRNEARGTIIDDDRPRISVEAVKNAAEEDEKVGEFIITRSGDLTRPLKVSFSVKGSALRNKDYFLLPGAFRSESSFWTIPAHEKSIVVRVVPKDDTILEPTETVLLALQDTLEHGLTDARVAELKLFDNDSLVTVTADDPFAHEALVGPTGTAPDSATFTFRRVGIPTEELTVFYDLSGSAGADDFDRFEHLFPGPITFGVGVEEITITLTPVSDSFAFSTPGTGERRTFANVEGNETLTVALRSSTLVDAPHYTIGSRGSATITVMDTLYFGGSGPDPESLIQGQLGCWFAASIAGVARQRPEVITNMIVDNNDGTYSVTFPNLPGQGRVTVNFFGPEALQYPVPKNPSDPNYGPFVAPMGQANGVWFAVLAEAYGRATGNREAACGDNSVEHFLPQLTGNNAASIALGRTPDATLHQILNREFTVRRRVLVAFTPKGPGVREGIFDDHGYTVWGYNAATQIVTLRNLWGFEGEWRQRDGAKPPDGNNDGKFEMPLADFKRLFQTLTIEQ